MSPNPSSERQRRQVHFAESDEASLPRRIHYWWSRTPSQSGQDDPENVDPQQLEAGFGEHETPASRLADTEDIGDSPLIRSSWESPVPELADNNIDYPITISSTKFQEQEANEKDEQPFDYWNSRSENADNPAQQPPEYTEEARTLVRSFTSANNNRDHTDYTDARSVTSSSPYTNPR